MMATKMVREKKVPERVRKESPFIKVEEGRHWYQGLEAMAYLDMV